MASFSNRTIVRDLKNGERMGCTRLVDAYQARLVDEAVQVFHVEREDAEELVSDVLLAIVKNIHSFEFKRGDGDFHGWVVTVFRNKMRDFIRHRALTDGVMMRFDESSFYKEESSSPLERQITDVIIRQYQNAVQHSEGEGDNVLAAKLLTIGDALERLEAWERVLLRCRALDVPYEDIAQYTGKSVSQLKVYHARVKKRFVHILSEYYPELKSNDEGTG